MTKKYSEEFKKQMVQEYLKGTSYLLWYTKVVTFRSDKIE